MTKLTTELLEKKIKSCIEIENCEVMMPLSAAQELLAFRNAAKNPVAWRVSSFAGLPTVTFYEDVKDSMIANGQTPEPLYAAPVLPKQPEPTISFYRDGIIAAAKWVENQRDAYDNEHGHSEPDTGAFEFGNDAQLEYSTTLSEIAEGIRSLHPTSAQPVSEPYKLPDGWKLVPIEPTAAMFHAFNDCDYGRKSMRERYIQMIEAAPAQESE